MADYSDDRLDQIWDKGHRMRGKDPEHYRKDDLGNVMFRPSYGKLSDMGWEVDHKNPVDKGGTDNLRNLRPLNTAANREKSNN